MVLATQFIDPLFHSFFYMQYVNLSICQIRFSTRYIVSDIGNITLQVEHILCCARTCQ
jgi:hypothetical protein